MVDKVDISVIIPVSERVDDICELHQQYKKAFEISSPTVEFLYVLDGPFEEVGESLRKMRREGEPIIIVQLSKWFGEATAMTAGFDTARGEILVTLPSYFQVDTAVLPRLVDALDNADVAIAARSRNNDTALQRMQGWTFNWLVSSLTSERFHDLGCSARAMKPKVAAELNLYGDQHRFLPILASQLGFRVVELQADKDPRDSGRRLYGPGVYLRRILDIVTVFFVSKFTKKPLRFFGLIGSSIAGAGAIIVSVLVIQRMLGMAALADRPALLLGSLLVVLGMQLFAIGLIGELIIFTHARHLKEYQVEKTINMAED